MHTYINKSQRLHNMQYNVPVKTSHTDATRVSTSHHMWLILFLPCIHLAALSINIA